MLYQIGHTAAVEALSTVRQSGRSTSYRWARRRLTRRVRSSKRYGDQQISFVDQTSAVLAREHEIEHLFAFDSDFSTMGFERVPVDIE
ncbi:hypothetical protein [Haladaptatus sp. W1]|uniref:hypothetical protein n=1 Tax=Haladaptatus sp. W1 TaxID=1897478 RepID=UPI00373FE182